MRIEFIQEILLTIVNRRKSLARGYLDMLLILCLELLLVKVQWEILFVMPCWILLRQIFLLLILFQYVLLGNKVISYKINNLRKFNFPKIIWNWSIRWWLLYDHNEWLRIDNCYGNSIGWLIWLLPNIWPLASCYY